MLREIFKTVPIPYLKRDDPLSPLGKTIFGGLEYHANQEPYIESMRWFNGIHVGRQQSNAKATLGDSNPDSPTSIYVWTTLNVAWWPSWGFGYYRFNGKTGVFVRRLGIPGTESIGQALAIGHVTTTRNGVPYATNWYGNAIFKISLGDTAQALVGEVPEDRDSWRLVAEGDPGGNPFDGYMVSRFHGEINSYGSFALDDQQGENIFLNLSYQDLRVFTWTTGELLYKTFLPNLGVAIALEDAQRCYILLEDRSIILFDYMRGEVLGASRIPPSESGLSYWNNGDVTLTYDAVNRRILIAEQTPDDPDTGACTCQIRGYRMVPEPTRLTVPIPLKAPRQRRVIPVLVQAVGDTNEGVGGYVIKAKVTGSGSLVGIPISDHYGNTVMQVACEGSSLFAESMGDWASTGSPEATPPHTGLVNISATAYVYQPDPPDIQTSAGPVDPSKPKIGAPGGGVDSGTGLHESAPNMFEVVKQVRASRKWVLGKGDAYDSTASDGRGEFTEQCANSMHDLDARWGHIKKNPGQLQYNKHSVDSVIFLNDDHVTAEIFSIVSTPTVKGDVTIKWEFVSRNSNSRSLWYYPA